MCIASVIESPFFAVVQRIMQKIFSCEIIETVKLKQGVPHCKNVSCRQLCLCIPGELSCPINITISSEQLNLFSADQELLNYWSCMNCLVHFVRPVVLLLFPSTEVSKSKTTQFFLQVSFVHFCCFSNCTSNSSLSQVQTTSLLWKCHS